jgi:hypothetical protein
LVNTVEVMEKEFAIQWITPQQKIIISDNEQLEEIYLMHGISENNKIPRFDIAAIIDSSLQVNRVRRGSNGDIGNSELKNSLM